MRKVLVVKGSRGREERQHLEKGHVVVFLEGEKGHKI